MRNLLAESLDPRVAYVAGQLKPLNHMTGVDDSSDLDLFVGYHAIAGTLHGVVAHAFSSGVSLSFRALQFLAPTVRRGRLGRNRYLPHNGPGRVSRGAPVAHVAPSRRCTWRNWPARRL